MKTGLNIHFKPISSSVVRITGDTEDITPHYKHGELVSLESEGTTLIKLCETFKIKTLSYKINIIERGVDENRIYYDLLVSHKTKASMFILPMLGGYDEMFFFHTLLINTFIGDGTYSNRIILLYRKSRTKKFQEFRTILEDSKHFEDVYEPFKGHICFVFRVPRRHINDYKWFLKGKYSKFTDIYKLEILEFHDFDIDDTIGQVLFKSKLLREQLEYELDAAIPKESELYDIMNKEEEIFNKNYYFNYE
jgi:hypothetical protein